jgi:hypothetical protein
MAAQLRDEYRASLKRISHIGFVPDTLPNRTLIRDFSLNVLVAEVIYFYFSFLWTAHATKCHQPRDEQWPTAEEILEDRKAFMV